MDRKTQETAARLWFWLQDCKEELESVPTPTPAQKRRMLALKTEGIVTRDRIVTERVRKVGGRA